MGILGRRRFPKPVESPYGLELLRRQLASPDPVFRRVAEEAQKAGSGTVIPFRSVQPIKNRRNAEVPGPRFRPACRYCGRPGAWICERCDKIRTGFDTAHMSRHSIADRRGWVGPPTIGDDELLVTISRRLRDADQRRVALDEKDAWKERRARRAAA
jgi:hypothetical protein